MTWEWMSKETSLHYISLTRLLFMGTVICGIYTWTCHRKKKHICSCFFLIGDFSMIDRPSDISAPADGGLTRLF